MAYRSYLEFLWNFPAEISRSSIGFAYLNLQRSDYLCSISRSLCCGIFCHFWTQFSLIISFYLDLILILFLFYDYIFILLLISYLLLIFFLILFLIFFFLFTFVFIVKNVMEGFRILDICLGKITEGARTCDLSCDVIGHSLAQPSIAYDVINTA